MKVYLVGGAVRDQQLGEPVHERDWVVVGSTRAALLEAGYQQVGRDFPVFLHPETKEEYALARTERKAGPGYHGFVCDASTDVTLEEDLARRDLTINAMAMDDTGQLIDPYDGAHDLQAKLLKHVSQAFTEDPVRVLRVARFAARYARLGFTVADETMKLMRQMAVQGELSHLVPERVWQEFHKSLHEQNPEVFIQVLQDADASAQVFLGCDALRLDSMRARLASVARHVDDPVVRFAAFLRPLGDEIAVKAWSTHLHVPNAYRDLARLTVMFGDIMQAEHMPGAEVMVQVLEHVDGFRKPERLSALLSACEAGTIVCCGWQDALKACQAIDMRELVRAGHQGAHMKKALHQGRVAAVSTCLNLKVNHEK